MDQEVGGSKSTQLYQRQLAASFVPRFRRVRTASAFAMQDEALSTQGRGRKGSTMSLERESQEQTPAMSPTALVSVVRSP